ncbi:type I methionyl aminopeptidase [Lacipirellula limnantheis]|uniref:Methionine aminopeptidase n=1 Tax=Lacipirellula limnantheis TaxID=2528024 RepID=A0A517U6F3_9BACT|nr:type I methionyl aminopeptidase [Lacipirellula limnantheis]QDT76194.1 Methionine aminopeptidase 1 [Lacipirellula limnantheis]
MRIARRVDAAMVNLKSMREIGLMRRAGLAVWQAHQIAREMVRPGATTAEIDHAIGEHFAQLGAEPLFKNYPNSIRNKPPFPAVCCMSVNEAVVHGIPNNKPLVEGDILSLDTGCRLGGWCGDAAYTYSVGKIAPDVQRLLDATEGVLNLAIELMSSKSYWSAIAREMATYIRDHGYSTVECFVGHGIGREMHEEPQVPNFASRSLRGSGDFRIEPGLVIAVEPMVNMGTKRVKMLADTWTQVTADGKPSAHFEHTVAITPDGPTLLTVAPTPAELEKAAI